MWSAPIVFGQRSLHSFTLVHPAMPRAFCSYNYNGGRPFVKAPESAGHLSGGIGYPHQIEVPFSCLWVASRKTLLRTNGSHDRCTIDFARSILRPFAYRLGRQATEAKGFYRKQSFVEALRGMKVGRPTTT